VCATCPTPRLNQSYELRPSREQHLRYVPHRVCNGYNTALLHLSGCWRFFPCGRVAGHEADRSPLSSAEAINGCSRVFSPASVSLWDAAETTVRYVLYMKWGWLFLFYGSDTRNIPAIASLVGSWCCASESAQNLHCRAYCTVECDDALTLACLCFLLCVVKHRSLYLQTKLNLVNEWIYFIAKYRVSLSLEAPNYCLRIRSKNAGFSFVNTGKQVHLKLSRWHFKRNLVKETIEVLHSEIG